MKAIVNRDFASVVLGNLSAGQVIEVSDGHFRNLETHGLVRSFRPATVVDEAPVAAPVMAPVVVVETPPAMTDERQELLAKAAALDIKVDMRWSTRRLKKVVQG